MRLSLRTMTGLAVAAILMGLTQPIRAQDDTQKSAVQRKLKEQFTLTKLTSDRSDIVTAGSILVLHKDGLQMCSIEAKAPMTSTYKNGNISYGFGAKVGWGASLGLASQGKNASEIPQRKFVAGEKFWITSYTAQNDAVLLQFYSDPFDGVRYYGQLKIPYPKGAIPAAEDVMKTIAEVVTAEPVQDAKQDSPQPAPAPAAEVVAPPPIAPPPPPADEAAAAPATVSLGQTPKEVVAVLGQPLTKAGVGKRDIYMYKDLKVTFLNGKVEDIQ